MPNYWVHHNALPVFGKLYSEMTEEEKNYELGKQIVTAVANLFISPVILFLVWNAVMPGLFGVATLGYWSAMGLYIISRILLKKND